MQTTVRWRMTAGAVAVVGLALGVGSAALVGAVGDTVRGQVETAADLRAEDIVALSRSGRLDVLAVEDDEDGAVLLLAQDGTVLASSANLRDRSTMPAVPVGQTREASLPIGEDRFLVLSRSAGEGARVLVASSLEPVREATGTMISRLLLGVPLVVLLVGMTTWVVAGRALRPVELLRQDVAEISASNLSRRVPGLSGNDEVARLGRTMNAMLERLETSADRQRRFVSDASHELRSPLTSIRHQLDIAAAQPHLTSVEQLTGALLQEEIRLEALVVDLLLLARSDEGSRPTWRAVDLDDLLHAQARRAREVSAVDVDVSGIQPVQVRGDPAALARLTSNLIDNALRHAVSRMLLAVAVTDGEVVLTVDDDGAGIAAADRSRVFERFTRLDEGRARDTGGSGLGLAVVAEVARQHGGRATVEGACFTVRLPVNAA